MTAVPVVGTNGPGSGGTTHEGYDMNRTNLIGLFLILGTAVGFTLGLIVAGVGMAAVYGAFGGGLGIVLGAAVASTQSRETTRR